jgi:hypothetical protein
MNCFAAYNSFFDHFKLANLTGVIIGSKFIMAASHCVHYSKYWLISCGFAKGLEANFICGGSKYGGIKSWK